MQDGLSCGAVAAMVVMNGTNQRGSAHRHSMTMGREREAALGGLDLTGDADVQMNEDTNNLLPDLDETTRTTRTASVLPTSEHHKTATHVRGRHRRP